MKISLFGGWGLTPAKAGTLEKGVRAALGRLARRRGEVCLVLLDDRKVRRMNREYLGRDRNTDVIAFGYQEGGARPPLGKSSDDAPFGDIFISKGVARRQAREAGHPLYDELLLLAVHGALHLAGYDDGRAAEKRRMFERQELIVERLRKA